MPTYQQNKPLPTDQLSVSQGDIEQNYQSIKALVDVNHGTFTGGVSPEGKHIKVDVTRIGAEPVAAGTDLTMYNFLNAVTAQSEMYVRRNGAAGTPFTAAIIANDTGWTYLPSGTLIKWGQATYTGAGTVTFDATHAFTVRPSVIVSAFKNIAPYNYAITLTVVTTTNFSVYCSARTTTGPANTTFNWIAIGK